METHKVIDNPLLLSASWGDSEWELFESWLKDMLVMGPVTVTFTKKDGTDRVMECTLQPELLPKIAKAKIKEGEEKSPRKQSQDVIPVYDIEAKSWRSFTIKSVKRISLTIC